MKRIVLLAVLFFTAGTAFAEMNSDIQGGFCYAYQQETYQAANSNYINKTNRIGFEISNFNFTQDYWFGFFENLNLEFCRWGSSRSDGHSYNYNSDSFCALEFVAGPAFLIKQTGDSAVQIGIGLHGQVQKCEEDGYTYTDNTIGVGIIINEKLFSTKRFSCITGVKASFDIKDYKMYTYSGSTYRIKTKDYSMFEIEPHILFCYNF